MLDKSFNPCSKSKNFCRRCTRRQTAAGYVPGTGTISVKSSPSPSVPDRTAERDITHLQHGYWNWVCLSPSGMSCVERIYRVFAGASIILNSAGSVGMTFVMWIIGALVAAAGTAVYIELGTVTFSLLHHRSIQVPDISSDQGSPSQRRRQGLLRVHLSTPSVHD
jgi:hypothetical protein